MTIKAKESGGEPNHINLSLAQLRETAQDYIDHYDNTLAKLHHRLGQLGLFYVIREQDEEGYSIWTRDNPRTRMKETKALDEDWPFWRAIGDFKKVEADSMNTYELRAAIRKNPDTYWEEAKGFSLDMVKLLAGAINLFALVLWAASGFPVILISLAATAAILPPIFILTKRHCDKQYIGNQEKLETTLTAIDPRAPGHFENYRNEFVTMHQLGKALADAKTQKEAAQKLIARGQTCKPEMTISINPDLICPHASDLDQDWMSLLKESETQFLLLEEENDSLQALSRKIGMDQSTTLKADEQTVLNGLILQLTLFSSGLQKSHMSQTAQNAMATIRDEYTPCLSENMLIELGHQQPRLHQVFMEHFGLGLPENMRPQDGDDLRRRLASHGKGSDLNSSKSKAAPTSAHIHENKL